MSKALPLSEVLKLLKIKATEAMSKENSTVQKVVIDEYIESIEENVYDAYHSPAKNPYKRQMDNGGLTDRSNFRVEKTIDGIAISSSRKGYNSSGEEVDVMDVLEGNEEWSVDDIWGYGFQKRRATVEPVREELRNSNKLSNALKEDLTKFD